MDTFELLEAKRWTDEAKHRVAPVADQSGDMGPIRYHGIKDRQKSPWCAMLCWGSPACLLQRRIDGGEQT